MFTSRINRLGMIFRAAMVVWAAGTAVPASAAQDDGSSATVEKKVSYHGLDLTSEAGRTELRHRITRASREVCGEAYGWKDYGDADFRACVQQAFTDAWGQAATAIAAAESRTQVASSAAK
jgi:UrcA family protein